MSGVSFYSIDNKPKDFQCSICLNSDGSDLVVHQANDSEGNPTIQHIFDKKCLKKWVKQCQPGKEFCPLCKKTINLTSRSTANKREILYLMDTIFLFFLMGVFFHIIFIG